MNIRTECPRCHIENTCVYEYGKEVYPFRCHICGLVYVISIEPQGPVVETLNMRSFPDGLIKSNITEMVIGTPVYISSCDSPLYLEQGEVTDKKHKHYKIKFISCDKRIDGKCLWMVDDQVDPIPLDILGRKDET